MAVGIATLIVIGVSAAVSAYSAHKAAEAQKESTEAQTKTADKSLAVQKEMYEQTRTDEAPYRQFGSGALNQLAFGLGIDLPAKPVITAAPGPPPPEKAVPRVPGPIVTRPGEPRSAAPAGAVPTTPAGAPGPGAAPQAAAAAQTRSGYIRMRAPTGEVELVGPEEQDTMRAQGAEEIA